MRKKLGLMMDARAPAEAVEMMMHMPIMHDNNWYDLVNDVEFGSFTVARCLG